MDHADVVARQRRAKLTELDYVRDLAKAHEAARDWKLAAEQWRRATGILETIRRLDDVFNRLTVPWEGDAPHDLH